MTDNTEEDIKEILINAIKMTELDVRMRTLIDFKVLNVTCTKDYNEYIVNIITNAPDRLQIFNVCSDIPIIGRVRYIIN